VPRSSSNLDLPNTEQTQVRFEIGFGLFPRSHSTPTPTRTTIVTCVVVVAAAVAVEMDSGSFLWLAKVWVEKIRVRKDGRGSTRLKRARVTPSWVTVTREKG